MDIKPQTESTAREKIGQMLNIIDLAKGMPGYEASARAPFKARIGNTPYVKEVDGREVSHIFYTGFSLSLFNEIARIFEEKAGFGRPNKAENEEGHQVLKFSNGVCMNFVPHKAGGVCVVLPDNILQQLVEFRLSSAIERS